MFKESYTTIKQLFKTKPELLFNTTVTVKGWIQSARPQANIFFIELYDGSFATPLQLIIEDQEIIKEIIQTSHNGASLEAVGKIVKSPKQDQSIELKVEKIKILSKIEDPGTYLPCAKKVPLDTIRDFQHLKPKFRTYRSIYRIRSYLMRVVSEFMHRHDVLHLDPNICTSSDCEGAGETFTITNMFKDGLKSKIPTLENSDRIDFSKDFFTKQTFLTVSSQLQLEALCHGMGAVFTTNPSFRAEHSQTKRHLACFTHLEWELPFLDLDQLMNFSEDLVTYCFKGVLKDCHEDVKFLDSFHAKGLIKKLESFVQDKFTRISYKEAVKHVLDNKEVIYKLYADPKNPKVTKELRESLDIFKYGDDLGSFFERFITEQIYKKPVFVHHYPKDLKAFYMRPSINDTVENYDLLIPSLGELIGSSMRNEDYDSLLAEIRRRNINTEPLKWYTDLRKNGGIITGGAGLGFDRLVTICTSGLDPGNIRDVVPFPVAYQECEY